MKAEHLMSNIYPALRNYPSFAKSQEFLFRIPSAGLSFKHSKLKVSYSTLIKLRPLITSLDKHVINPRYLSQDNLF